MSTSSGAGRSPSLAQQIFRTTVAVLAFLSLGLLAALLLSRSITDYYQIGSIVPSNIGLLADFSLIIVGVVLAEVATPTREVDNLFKSWNLTSFTVATATLASLGLYAVETFSHDPDRLNVLIAILRLEHHPWTFTDQLIYRGSVSLAVFLCLLVAALAAFMQRGISSNASHKASLSLYAQSYAVLFSSIFLFCTYILLTHEWTKFSTEDRAKPLDLTLVQRSIVLIGVLSIVATMIVWKVHRLSGTLRPYLDAPKDKIKSLFSLFKATTKAILLLLVTILTAEVLFGEFSGDELLRNAAIDFVGKHLSSLGTSEEVGNKAVDLLGSFFDVAEQLTGFLYILAEVLAFLLVVTIGIGTILYIGDVSRIFQRIGTVIKRPAIENSAEPQPELIKPSDNRTEALRIVSQLIENVLSPLGFVIYLFMWILFIAMNLLLAYVVYRQVQPDELANKIEDLLEHSFYVSVGIGKVLFSLFVVPLAFSLLLVGLIVAFVYALLRVNYIFDLIRSRLKKLSFAVVLRGVTHSIWALFKSRLYWRVLLNPLVIALVLCVFAWSDPASPPVEPLPVVIWPPDPLVLPVPVVIWPPDPLVLPPPPAPATESKEIVFYRASFDCGIGQQMFWKSGKTDLLDSKPRPVDVKSCHVNPNTCEGVTIVGVGTASSTGDKAKEDPRALQRGISLASALTRGLPTKCKSSAYVLNLGQYGKQDQRSDHDQLEAIALIGTDSDDIGEAVSHALARYAKSGDRMFDNTATCELYKLDDVNNPTPDNRKPIPTPLKICGDRAEHTQ